jgi:hypothetical protein
MMRNVSGWVTQLLKRHSSCSLKNESKLSFSSDNPYYQLINFSVHQKVFGGYLMRLAYEVRFAASLKTADKICCSARDRECSSIHSWFSSIPLTWQHLFRSSRSYRLHSQFDISNSSHNLKSGLSHHCRMSLLSLVRHPCVLLICIFP